MSTVKSENLVVYAIWEPILRTDDERSSRKATTLLSDARVRHYWTDSQDLGTRFQPAIDLTTEPAWDVYLVYRPGRRWDEAPPKPDYFMHQLGGRLPQDRSLDAEILAGQIRQFLQ